jgi:hypothetical protein
MGMDHWTVIMDSITRKTEIRWINPNWVVNVLIMKENTIGGNYWQITKTEMFKSEEKAIKFASKYI